MDWLGLMWFYCLGGGALVWCLIIVIVGICVWWVVTYLGYFCCVAIGSVRWICYGWRVGWGCMFVVCRKFVLVGGCVCCGCVGWLVVGIDVWVGWWLGLMCLLGWVGVFVG